MKYIICYSKTEIYCKMSEFFIKPVVSVLWGKMKSWIPVNSIKKQKQKKHDGSL